jgi:glycosyltransferase involved in cell wall biosynthesis
VKIFLFANTDWYLYNFRLGLARALSKSGAEVVLLSPDGPYRKRLQAEGFRWIWAPMERGSLNPLREILLLVRLFRLYRRERPDVVHHFTIKCVVYGSFVARLAGISRRVNAVAGMGYVFANEALRARLLRPLVRWFMKLALGGRQARLILQNPDDCAAFAQLGLIDSALVRLIRGSGVDTDRFQPAKLARTKHDGFRVILAARLLWDKGIQEYVEAARQLIEAGHRVEFLLAGSSDPGNPAAIPSPIIRGWRDAGFVTILGHVEDILHLLHTSDVAVLPTYYREGVPRSLIEAASCGLPTIASDAPGCREIVRHNINGLLVPCRNAKALADAIRHLLENPDERARMGAAGRERVLEEFDEKIVLAKTLDVYRELVPNAFPSSVSVVTEAR